MKNEEMKKFGIRSSRRNPRMSEGTRDCDKEKGSVTYAAQYLE